MPRLFKVDADRKRHAGHGEQSFQVCLPFLCLSEVGAAPHLPAGILSPYSDGERGAAIADFANRHRRMGAKIAASLLLPVTIRGE
ncbi:hypothetical protein EN779_34750, partial [Mesorhizobium sp. M4B.F.Ca.ET.088.02.2.1]